MSDHLLRLARIVDCWFNLERLDVVKLREEAASIVRDLEAAPATERRTITREEFDRVTHAIANEYNCGCDFPHATGPHRGGRMTAPSEEQVRAQLTRLAFLASGWEDRACLLGNMTASEITESARAALALLDAGRKDRERVDWMEQQHTLHGAVEMLYVVDGYTVNVTHDGNPTGEHWGETLRAAIDRARGA